ncbi:UDP-N-acetylglucosamine 2-epimerase [Polynucleobacter sp. UB-Siik-W21]|uniref:UDP-N-acetylglucosamine 2-epimerase n=1 Tax=Polynucleobacter sp. UB-Siik-W21 TaxID=1855646 RepID=UPI001BFE0E0B|nr:UDP-N-acetylglucosamine 2-epimerase [Polynucleobacter sp. UB-Siik-W21]QWD70714.1 UDP-N-acetylglucosamine 2-epimerase (hydrolyzing) [Polynucleobacter sp. UB-Siik-W21]
MNRKKIAVFTGNRAEYGLQTPILSALKMRIDMDYCLIVSGAHLDPNYGSTLDEIQNDGFIVGAEVHIASEPDSRVSTAKAIASGIVAIADALERLSPSMLIVYADRFESFAAVIAATQMGIPTVHVEGGDLTEGGALDDTVRHAMSKLAHIHFTTNSQATNRLLAMGEESWRVMQVGLPTLDLVANKDYSSVEEIKEKLKLNFEKPIILFTQHSVTTQFQEVLSQLTPSLDALKILAKKGFQVIITYPNNDAGGQAIADQLVKLQHENFENIQVHKSLGRRLYHGVLSLALDDFCKIVCVGNSSSGIKEAQAFHCPAVNIGSRQDGRLRGVNVIDVDYCTEGIVRAIENCIDNKVFREKCRKSDNPYYFGDAGSKIAEFLANLSLDDRLLRKKMTIV